MNRPLPILLAAILLGGCAGAVPAPSGPGVAPPRVGVSNVGLERVMGHSSRDLIALFGQPDAQVAEGAGRRMQFRSGICVLDAYLYPPERDARATPVVTHVDARQPDGRPIDRASCVAAVARRSGGR